ncbi:Isochorismatase-like protein [Xylogone sp. PMI_703]|nr:Isochorismatase-like protein [Xylogone sp. PMI_703]
MFENTAIVIIDPYNDFLHEKGKIYPLIADSLKTMNTIKHLQQIIKAAREHNIKIFYGLHQQARPGVITGWKHAHMHLQNQQENRVFEEGSFGGEIYEGLKLDLEYGDLIVSKHWASSSFQSTDLDYQLRQCDIQKLVICGLAANTCVESTARYAYELGYHVTMITDATAGFTPETMHAATDLIWPMFAQEVKKTGEWIAGLKQ